MKAFKTMFKTELKLSIRGMDMIIFAICMPVVVMVVLGIIYGNRPAFDGAQYTFLEQSFGAVSTIAIAAGGVMGLPLVISDYRHKKILKRFKVTPTSPTLILAVQVLIYTLYSMVSLALIYGCASIFFGYKMEGSWVKFLSAYILVLISMFSIGVLVGGVASNIKTASILASILYFPMLVFSGATLPYEIMPIPLQRIADFMPLTQGIKLLKSISLDTPISNVWISILAMSLLAVGCISFSIKFFKWE